MDRGIVGREGQRIVCFFGTIGRQFDLETVVNAARILSIAAPEIRFVLCGSGDWEERYRDMSSGLPNVLFPGWVDTAEIQALMGLADAGLAPYRTTPNFTMNLPNKPIEYLSAGLPVVTGVEGVLSRLIEEHQCGILYRQGDPASLAASLRQLFADPGNLRRIRENACTLFRERFAAERVYPALSQFLEEVAQRGCKTRAASFNPATGF
jgi:glycosyltransferase involved in cell wall biosynthesis